MWHRHHSRESSVKSLSDLEQARSRLGDRPAPLPAGGKAADHALAFWQHPAAGKAGNTANLNWPVRGQDGAAGPMHWPLVRSRSPWIVRSRSMQSPRLMFSIWVSSTRGPIINRVKGSIRPASCPGSRRTRRTGRVAWCLMACSTPAPAVLQEKTIAPPPAAAAPAALQHCIRLRSGPACALRYSDDHFVVRLTLGHRSRLAQGGGALGLDATIPRADYRRPNHGDG